MASEVLVALVGLFCTTVSSIVTFILTRRKYNTEVDSQQIKNVDDSFEVYKKVMNEALATQNEKIELLQKENDSLRKQVNELQKQMINMIGMLHVSPSTPKDIESMAQKDM